MGLMGKTEEPGGLTRKVTTPGFYLFQAIVNLLMAGSFGLMSTNGDLYPWFLAPIFIVVSVVYFYSWQRARQNA